MQNALIVRSVFLPFASDALSYPLLMVREISCPLYYDIKNGFAVDYSYDARENSQVK